MCDNRKKWRFRPLSWGLSFNSIVLDDAGDVVKRKSFSSPFLGTFFQCTEDLITDAITYVFVPFLGDFLSMVDIVVSMAAYFCFRPLSWGLSFNTKEGVHINSESAMFSSPFLGTFFQWQRTDRMCFERKVSFSSPFLGTFFQSEKPVKVCEHDGASFRPLSWGLSFNMSQSR